MCRNTLAFVTVAHGGLIFDSILEPREVIKSHIRTSVVWDQGPPVLGVGAIDGGT
jgi:hypothetical protein